MQGIRQVAIIGTGLLGGSIGLGLRAAGYGGAIVGVGRRDATLARARERGCIDHGTTHLESALEQSDLAILCTPLGQFPDLLEQIARVHRPELIMTDVGSVKEQVMRDAKRVLAPEMFRRFIGSHPMAGGELNGPDVASADLFQNKPCVVVTHEHALPQAQQVVQSLWTSLGMNVLSLPAPEHDRLVAAASHLPHLLAALLVNQVSDQKAMGVASTGFGDTTRIASGDPALWQDIFEMNRQAVLESVRQMQKHLAAAEQMLERGDLDQLLSLLQKAKKTRDHWLKERS